MNEIKLFENPEFGSIRTMVIDNEPWFVGKDVAVALGYTNPSKALADHVDEEDKLNNESLLSLGQRGGWLINESGLYSLIFSSQLPSAKKFKRWMTSEVLPSIRKTGRYEIGTQEYMPTRPLTTDDYAEAARTIAKCHNSRLPIVLDLYRKAGLDIESICQVQSVVEDEDDVDLVELLQQYTLNELVGLLNIARSSIFYYRTGRVKPQKKRRDFIIQTLTVKR